MRKTLTQRNAELYEENRKLATERNNLKADIDMLMEIVFPEPKDMDRGMSLYQEARRVFKDKDTTDLIVEVKMMARERRELRKEQYQLDHRHPMEREATELDRLYLLTRILSGQKGAFLPEEIAKVGGVLLPGQVNEIHHGPMDPRFN